MILVLKDGYDPPHVINIKNVPVAFHLNVIKVTTNWILQIWTDDSFFFFFFFFFFCQKP